MIGQLRDTKEGNNASNGGLKDQANRAGVKAKFASPKSHDQREGVSIRSRTANRETKETGNILLGMQPRDEGEIRQGRQGHKEGKRQNGEQSK